jgi:hypothetical protein
MIPAGSALAATTPRRAAAPGCSAMSNAPLATCTASSRPRTQPQNAAEPPRAAGGSSSSSKREQSSPSDIEG